MTTNSLMNHTFLQFTTTLGSGSKYIKAKTTKLLSTNHSIPEKFLNPDKLKNSEMMIPKLGRVKIQIVSRRNWQIKPWK